MVAVVPEGFLDDRLVAALVGHDEHGRTVDQQSRAAEEREHEEADAVEGRVDVEVAAEAAADAGDHPIGLAPAELLVSRVFRGCRVFGHGCSVPGDVVGVDPVNPWSDPTIDPGWRRG